MVTSLHILVVDDEEIVRQTLGDYLSACGHTVVQAEDGRQATALLDGDAFHLVLADVRMPGLDGFGLLDQVRERVPGTPVVVMTGHGDAETEAQAGRHGAAGFIVKPIRLRDLDGIIRAALSAPR